jgi:tripartite-type tricarboxylate transporter receptor subunit TctC
MFMNLEGVARLIEARRVRVLARSEGAKLASPQVAQAPVASHLWPEIVLESHFGVLVPGRTAPGRIRELNGIFNQVLADPQFAAFLARDGGVAIGGAPERYKQSLQRTRDRYAMVIRQLGLGPK